MLCTMNTFFFILFHMYGLYFVLILNVKHNENLSKNVSHDLRLIKLKREMCITTIIIKVCGAILFFILLLLFFCFLISYCIF